MFKDKGSMLIRHYADLVPKLLSIAKDDEKKFPPEKCFKFADCKYICYPLDLIDLLIIENLKIYKGGFSRR